MKIADILLTLNNFRVFFVKFKITDILLTLIFIVLVIIGYYVWNIDSRIEKISGDIDSINTTLNNWELTE